MDQPSSVTRRCLLRSAAGIVAGVGLAAPGIVRAAEFPTNGWATASPASVGLELAGLQEGQRFAEQYGGAGCVIRHGRVAHVWGSFDERYQVQSTTKSWGSAVLGMALDEGRLALGLGNRPRRRDDEHPRQAGPPGTCSGHGPQAGRAVSRA